MHQRVAKVGLSIGQGLLKGAKEACGVVPHRNYIVVLNGSIKFPVELLVIEVQVLLVELLIVLLFLCVIQAREDPC